MNTKAIVTTLFFFFFLLFLAAMILNAAAGNATVTSTGMSMNGVTILSGVCLGLPTLLFGLLVLFSHLYDDIGN